MAVNNNVLWCQIKVPHVSLIEIIGTFISVTGAENVDYSFTLARNM